jgi:hypothetical protein
VETCPVQRTRLDLTAIVHIVTDARVSHLPKTAGREVETKMSKKNVIIITKLKVEMNVRGKMSFTEIKDWICLNSKYGLTSNQLGNILAKGSDFDKVDEWATRHAVTGSTWKETVWEVRS